MHGVSLMVLVAVSLLGFQESSSVTAETLQHEQCPSINTIPSTLLPHESDCGLYYICHLGKRLLMPRCPRGMLFDTLSSKCRVPPNVTCGGVHRTTTVQINPPTAPILSSESIGVTGDLVTTEILSTLSQSTIGTADTNFPTAPGKYI